MRVYAYTKKTRSNIVKKKILIRKLVSYYYNFSYNKKLKSIVNFSKKLKNRTAVDSTSNIMNVFELHLSVFVLRCKFVSNILDSKSLITGGNLLVNGVVVYNPGYILNLGDIVQLKRSYSDFFFNKYIIINKPPRWRKNRFFYKINTRNVASNILKNKKVFYKLSKLRKYGLLFNIKHFYRRRKFSLNFFKIRFFRYYKKIQQY